MTPRVTSETQLLALSTLIQLQRDTRHAKSIAALAHLIVNETQRLIPYQQSVFWRCTKGGGTKVVAISGVALPNFNAPYTQWMQQLLKVLAGQKGRAQPRQMTLEDLPAELQDGWREWSPGALFWRPFSDTEGETFAGTLLFRDHPWSEGEMVLLDHLSDAYQHALTALEHGGKSLFSRLGRQVLGRRFRLLFVAALLGALVLPIRESALAPAEVSPSNPVVVSAPLDGVVKSFFVQPNQPVAEGDLLFALDETTIRSEHEVAGKVLAIAKADYLRASQKAFRDADSKAKLASLRAVVDEKTAELAYSARLLERIRVRAVQEGIALFTDPNDWLGKPVVTGEKVLTLADPAHTEVRAWIPVDDAINLEPGAEVQLFLNTDPTHSLAGTLYQTAYEAEMSPGGILAFPVKARFINVENVPRIGLKGTAKIYGREVMLFYYLFRRPIASLRQFLGL